MTLRERYDEYMRRWKAGNRPVTKLSCPHCKQDHEVSRIPNTDSLHSCPHCEELCFKVIDGHGQAHAHVPGLPS
jgi:hypothetical protein